MHLMYTCDGNTLQPIDPIIQNLYHWYLEPV
jgi:hypothetical protein